MTKRYLTPPEIAKRYGCKPEKVIGWIKRGELRAINSGDGIRPRWKVRPEDLEAFEAARSNVATIAPKPTRRQRRKPEGVIQFYT